MKVEQLFEAKKVKAAPPEWVLKLDAEFKAMLDRFGYATKQKPYHSGKQGDMWQFGGELKFIEKDSPVDEEDLIEALCKEAAKFLINLAKSERIVQLVTSIHWYRTDHRLIQSTDDVRRIAETIRRHVHMRTDNITRKPVWQLVWRIEDPKEFKAPAPMAPKTVIRVKRGT